MGKFKLEMKEMPKDDEIKVGLSQFPEIVTLCDLGYFKALWYLTIFLKKS